MPEPLTAGAAYQTAQKVIPIVSRFLKWYKGRRVPKAKKNTYGIAVAIKTEGERERAQIASDFVATIEEVISRSTVTPRLSLVDIPESIATKIKNLEDSRKILDRSECVLIVWGKARRRMVKGSAMWLLDLSTQVKHETITMGESRQLSAEMGEMLPARRAISADNDLIEFETNAAGAALAVKYVVGTAARLSGKFDFAIELFAELRREMPRMTRDIPPEVLRSLRAMKAKIPINLAGAHLLESTRLQMQWRRTRDPEFLDQMDSHLSKAEALLPNFYDVWVSRALYHFVKGRDLKAAWRQVDKCKVHNIEDSAWRLSEAFLYAYAGRMTEAVRSYRRALSRPFTSPLVMEVEEFIEWVLEEEPDKVQLHFCLGFLNGAAKGDVEIARRHYKNFLAATGEDQFREQRALAQKFLDGR